MSMQLKKAPKQRAFVSSALIATIIAIGLLALIEKGPVAPGVPVGASPLNPMALGTSQLVDLVAKNYSITIIHSLTELSRVRGELCTYVTISPEVPYRSEEANSIASMLKERCARLKILVADESTYSNTLLQALNSSIRINGDRILLVTAPRGGETTRLELSPYPPANITIRTSHILILDKASTVSGGGAIGYAYARSESEVLCLADPNGNVYKCEAAFAIASRDLVKGVEILAIGDGSILLNQVFSSNRSEYMFFTQELFSYLCENNPHCTVIFDAMHYISLSPRDLLNNPSYSLRELAKDPTTLLYLMPSVLAIILHPSVWLPPLIQLLSTLLEKALASIAGAAVILLLTLLIYRMVMGDARTSHDSRLPEQVEEEVGVFAELRKSIATGKVKLTKRDFASLCQTLDAMLKFYRGSGLWSEQALDVLAELLGDRKRAYRELQWVLKLYRKAVGKSWLPILVLWRRAVKRLVRLVEEIGKSISERIGVNIV